MKITKQQLKQIIKEELAAILREEEIEEGFSGGMEGSVGYGGSIDSVRKVYGDHEIEAMSDEEKEQIYQETGVWPHTQAEKEAVELSGPTGLDYNQPELPRNRPAPPPASPLTGPNRRRNMIRKHLRRNR